MLTQPKPGVPKFALGGPRTQSAVPSSIASSDSVPAGVTVWVAARIDVGRGQKDADRTHVSVIKSAQARVGAVRFRMMFTLA